MKHDKKNLLGALHILRTALSTYDTGLAHNILTAGDTGQSEEDKEADLEKYIHTLDALIEASWLMEENQK